MTTSTATDSPASLEFTRWTARRKAAVVLDLIKGKTTVSEAARTCDQTVAEIQTW